MQKPFYLLSWAMIFLRALLWGLFWSLVSIFFSNKNVSFLKSSNGELLHVLVSRTMPYSQVNVDQIRFLVFFLKIAKIWQNCQNHFHVVVFQMAVKWVRFFCFSNDVKQEFQKNIFFCFIDCAKAFDCVGHNKLWKSLKEMGIPDHLTCLLRNLYAGQEATVRPGHGTTDWFQIGKGVHQGCILSPCLFNLHEE